MGARELALKPVAFSRELGCVRCVPGAPRSRPQPSIERLRKYREPPDAPRIAVAGIHEHVVGLRHEHAAHLKTNGPRLLQPPIAPCARHGQAPRADGPPGATDSPVMLLMPRWDKTES